VTLTRTTFAAIFLAAAATVPARADVTVTARPTLVPAFKRHVHDYVSRCDEHHPLRLSVDGRVSTLHRRAGSGAAFSIGSRRYHVRCLPRDFPKWTAERRRRPEAQWYVTTPIRTAADGYVAMFDAHGTPVWWWHASTYAPLDAKLLPNGHLAWTRYLGFGFGLVDKEAYEERRLDGSLARVMRAVGNPTDTHDMQPMRGGHRAMIVYRARYHVDLSDYGGPPDATVWDGEIQEIDAGGRLVWSWNTKDHISLAEIGRWWPIFNKRRDPNETTGAYDLMHLNSVEPDAGGFVVSLRYLDAVLHVNRATGAIDWKLGGTHRPESLRILGDPMRAHPFGGQHDARVLPDGTVTVFDNATMLDRPPHAVRYRIDVGSGTATLLERVGEDSVRKSQFGGSARRLPGGDWVVSWGGRPLITEQTPSGELVLRIRFRDEANSYRAVPIEPGVLSAAKLRRGMNRMSRHGG
jgi:hypothetical protein